MLRAQRKHFFVAGVRPVLCGLTVAALACSDNAPDGPGPASVDQSVMTVPAAVTTNADANLTFTFRDEDDRSIDNAAVSFSTNLAGATFTPAQGTTDDNGSVATVFRSTAAGSASVTVNVAGTSITFPVAITVEAGTAGPCTIGALTIGTPATANITAGTGCELNEHPAATFRFTIPNGNAVAVTVGGAAPAGSPEFAITSDPAAGGTVLFIPSTGTSTQDWLLQPGTYLLSVSSSTSAVGNFTVNTTNAGAGAAGCVTRILVPVNATYVGQTLAGGATPDCIDNSGPFFEDTFAIFDERQCTITMTSTAFDAFLLIRNKNLEPIAEDDDTAGGTDARITRQCRSGTDPIFIAPSSFDANSTGAYTLTISFAPAAPGQPAETVTVAGPALSRFHSAPPPQTSGRRVKR